jgi:transcriptional regulator with XRE-family HTH domain
LPRLHTDHRERTGGIMTTRTQAPVGTFAARLRHLRTERGWSQATLAGLADMSTKHLAYLEHGYGEPQVYTMRKIAAALGISMSKLMEGVV